MDFKLVSSELKPPVNCPISMVCPACSILGQFEPFLWQDIYESITTINSEAHTIGIRRCPNPKCKKPVFFVANRTKNVLETYPHSRIDFDKTDIPVNVVDSFDEALECHANKCYRAAALMVRRTLEEICHELGATGDNLFERIESLKEKVIIPSDFFEGLHDLRYLGNDGAHIESNHFNNVGPDELEAGIEFTKDFLKALYQYKRSRQKLAALKKPPA